MGANSHHNWKLWGAAHPTLDYECHSFLYLFVFALELRFLVKNSEPNPGSFNFG